VTAIAAASLSDSNVRRATAIGLLAIVCWSATVGLVRSIAEALGPAGGAATFFTVSAVLLTLCRGLPRIHAFHPAYLAGGGLLFVAYEVCLALSLGYAHTRAQSLELGMINYLWPSLTMLLAVWAGQARARPWLWPGAALSFLGIVWVLTGDAGLSPHRFLLNLQDNPLAYGLAFLAAALWALYSVLTRRYGGGQNGVPLFLFAVAATLWVHYALSDEPPLSFSWSSALQVLLLGTLTATGYSCWNHGIQKGNMALMAVASYFTPVLSMLLACVWLGTLPTWAFWQGVLMVTAGSLVGWHATRG
jgi:drug/metabolite transporter (DMT)-like permease